MSQFSRTALTTLISASLLAACGGGGGSGGNPFEQATSTTPIITLVNYVAVAASAWGSSDVFGAAGSGINTGSSSGGGSSVVSLPDQMNTIYSTSSSAVQQINVLDQSFNQTCPQGGSLAGHVSLKLARSLSAGAQIDITGNNCSIANSSGNLNLNGQMSMLVVDNNGINLGFTFTNMNLAVGNDKLVLNGDNTLTRDSAGKTISSGKHLQFAAFRNGTQVFDRTLNNYSITYGKGATDTLQFNGSLTTASKALGSVNMTVQTTQGFQRGSNGYPQAGSMLVTAGGGTVKLTAIGGSSVKIDFSEKGNDVITHTTTMTFDQLKALQ